MYAIWEFPAGQVAGIQHFPCWNLASVSASGQGTCQRSRKSGGTAKLSKMKFKN